MRYMVVFFLAGCVGGRLHETMRYNSVQETAAENNRHLLSLRIGMSQADAFAEMGPPERSEGYPWGAVFLYRTAMTSGVYGTADTDFTPVVFDHDGWLIGWGRNFFAEQVRRYDIQVRQR